MEQGLGNEVWVTSNSLAVKYVLKHYNCQVLANFLQVLCRVCAGRQLAVGK